MNHRSHLRILHSVKLLDFVLDVNKGIFDIATTIRVNLFRNMPTFSGSIQYPKDTSIKTAVKQVPKTVLEDGITKLQTDFWVDTSEDAVAQVDEAVIGYGYGQQVSIRITDGVTTETITSPGNLGDTRSVAQALAEDITNVELIDGYIKFTSKISIVGASEEDYSITISAPSQADVTVSYSSPPSITEEEIATQLEISFEQINPSWFEVSRNGAELTLASSLELTASTTGTTTPANIETEDGAYLRIVANNPGDTITYVRLSPTGATNFVVTNITAASGSPIWKKIAQIKSWFTIAPGQRAVTSYVKRIFYKADGSVEKTGKENKETHPVNLENLVT